MTDFTQATVAALSAAGWTPGRSVDVHNHAKLLADAGFEVSPAALSFLQEFAGLDVAQPMPLPGLTSRIHFDVATTIEDVDAELVAQWVAVVGCALCPVGESSNNQQGIVIAADGRVFVGTERSLALVARDGRDAVDVLCSGRPVEPVAGDIAASRS